MLNVAVWSVLVMYVVPGFSPAVIAQQYSFEEVASGLKHQDAGTRLRAIQILKDADYAEATVPIAVALTDADDRVQVAAIDAERSLFTTRLIPRRKKVGLIVEVRTVAGGDAAATGQLALKARSVPPELLSGLAVALRDNSLKVRAEAISLAALLGPVTCAPDVRRASDSSACDGIGNGLIDMINSRQAVLRRAAMQALGQVRYPNAVQALSDQLSYHQKGPDAMAALEGLSGIGHATSVSIFESQLTSSDADMRRFAVAGLARAGYREALGTIQDMGQTERNDGVLLAMHYANVKLGAIDASLQQLVVSLGTPALRPLALAYLLDLSASHAQALAVSLTNPSADIRRLVADVLGFSRNADVIIQLGAAAQESDPDVAAAAQQAIARLHL